MDSKVADKVKAFFEAYPKRTYSKDQIIVFGGESPDKVFYIVAGKISQYDISYRGEEIVINVYKPPAFFPMTWAINGPANPYFFKADEESTVYVAPPTEVVAFIKDNPDVMFDLLSRLYRGVDGVLARMVHLMGGSARSRLMYEILIESRRFGKKMPDHTVHITLHEGDLASRSGLARETVNREIRHLKDKGIISVKDGKIIVKDMHSLEDQLGHTA